MSRIGWPYPRTRMQVTQTIIVAFLCLAVGGTGTLLVMLHYKNQPLSHDDVQQAALSLSGYSSEGAELVGQAARGQTPNTYQQVHLRQLGRQAGEVADFLTAHPAPRPLADSAKAAARSGEELRHVLEQNAAESDRAKLQHAQHILEQLHDQLERIGERT